MKTPSSRDAWLAVGCVLVLAGAAVLLRRAGESSSEITHVRAGSPRPATASPARGVAQLRALLAVCEATRATADEDIRLAELLATRSADDCRRLFALLADALPAEHRDRARQALLVRLAESAPAEAATLAAGLPDADARDRAVSGVVENWMRTDPASAADWLRLLATPECEPLLDRVVAHWGEVHLDAALAWVAELPAGRAQDRALQHLSHAWVATAPAQALAFALARPTENVELVASLAGWWAQRDPEAAAATLLPLPDSPGRTAAIASLAATWAGTAPRAAATFAAQLPAGPAQAAALASSVSGWARQEPAEAARWVTQFPSDAQRTEALPQVIPTWAARDAGAASEWLLQLPDGRAKDAALDLLSATLAARHPAIAVSLAQSIADEPTRLARLEFAARRWLAADPAQATAALRRAGLPAVVAASIFPASPP